MFEDKNTIYTHSQCRTMGHENCKKVLVRPYEGAPWKVDRIIHQVYGKTHIEFK